MRLYLIRHPRTPLGTDICYGSTDVPVSREALDAAVHGLAALPRRLPIVSSPLTRCAALAERLRTTLDSPALTFDARLAEMDFGAWEMRAWSAIARTEIDAWAADVACYRPGGGESLEEASRRVREAHDDLLRRQQDCIVVCHAGPIRLLLACSPGLAAPEMARRAADTSAIGYGEVVLLDR